MNLEHLKKRIVKFKLNGFRGWRDDAVDAIVGTDAAGAVMADIERLSLDDLVQLFHAVRAPAPKEMNGEYDAMILERGPMGFMAGIVTHRLFGPGRWVGKAFRPGARGQGWGYNLFEVRKKGKRTRTVRTRRMDVYIGRSNIDNKPSLHLDYSPYNKDLLIHAMHDEIRRIHPTLFIGMGYMSIGGGPLNPAPFVLAGPPSEWVGPDDDSGESPEGGSS